MLQYTILKGHKHIVPLNFEAKEFHYFLESKYYTQLLSII